MQALHAAEPAMYITTSDYTRGALKTLRIADFEVDDWLHTADARERMQALLDERL